MLPLANSSVLLVIPPVTITTTRHEVGYFSLYLGSAFNLL